MSDIYNFPDQIKGDTYKGASFEMIKDGEAVDLTGAEIVIKFRFFDFTGVQSHILESGEGITITEPTSGIFEILPFVVGMDIGKHVYDCQVTVDGVVKTYFRGSIIINPEVSY